MSLLALYNTTLDEGFVYLVVEYGDIPVLIPYDDVVQNEYVPDDDGTAEEGLINVFTSEEAAEDERLDLIEAYNRRPSDLKVIKLTITALWSLIDELESMFTVGTGHQFRIDLVMSVHATTGSTYVTDTIYSPQVPIN